MHVTVDIFESKKNPDKNLAEFLRTGPFEADPDFWIKLYNGSSCPKIIEFGCGCGNLSIPLARAGYCVTAVDINPYAISLLKKIYNGNNLNAQCADMEDFQIGSYDILILRSCVLNTIEGRSRFRFFRNATKIMNPNAVLICEIYKSDVFLAKYHFENESQSFDFETDGYGKSNLRAIYKRHNVTYVLHENLSFIDYRQKIKLAKSSNLILIYDGIPRTRLSELIVFARQI